jgi:hypothetical protein
LINGPDASIDLSSASVGNASVSPQSQAASSTALSFAEFLAKSHKGNPGSDLIEIGDFQFKVGAQSNSSSHDKKKEETKDSSLSQGALPFIAQFLAHAVTPIDTVHFGPMLQSFIRETAQVIRTQNPLTGQHNFLFSFTEPPLKVQFESHGQSLNIQIITDKDLGKEFQEFRTHKMDLQVSLQKIFPDLDIQLHLRDEAAMGAGQDNPGGQSQQQSSQQENQDSYDDDSPL